MRRPDLRLVPGAAPVSAMTVADGVGHYLQRLAARGARPNTLLAYRSALMQFALFLRWLGHGELVATLSQLQVSRWLDDLNARGLSPRSQAHRLTVLRGFVRHARREGWLHHDPAQDERVRFRARRVIAPELDQLHAMVEAIGTEHALDLRDRAMLRLALDTGLRVSEVASLDIPGAGTQTSIDLRRQLVHCISKGGDTETVPFNARTGRMVEEFLRVRHELAAPGELALFPSSRGGRASRQALHEMIKRRADAAGLQNIHWHLLRHRRIAQVVETCGTKVAQQFARHASESTTGHYGRHADSVAFALVRERADLDLGRIA